MTANIPVVPTRDLRQQLHDLGLSRAEVDAMSPVQMWEYLNQKQPEISPTTPPEQPEAAQPLGQTLDDLDGQLHRSAIANSLDLLEEIENDLENNFTSHAQLLADHLRGALADEDEHIRADVITHLKTRIALSGNGHKSIINELLGFARDAAGNGVQNTDVQELLIADTIKQASIEKDHNRRDELLGAAFNVIATLGPIAIGRWRPHICKIAGIERGTFDTLIREAKKAKSKPATNTANGDSDKPYTPTDDELADRWLAMHPFTSYGLGEYRRYQDGIWPITPIDAIKGEIKDQLEREKLLGVRPTSRLLASVLELARIGISIPTERWDADPDLLPCKNGMLHIPTRQLLPHKPENYQTTALAFDYNPDVYAKTWDDFLESTVPFAALFLQEFAGLCLTVSTRYEIALWLHGPAGSGRSTFLMGLQSMLGTRAGLLGLADIVRSQFALTNLPGKTLVVSTEQPGDYISSANTLNAIISGEPISVDRKFRDAITIIPKAKIAWAMNSMPRVGEASSGLFRRVRVVEFPARPAGERDPTVKERIMLEGQGILNWALDGLDRLTARGRFDVPDEVVSATENFQQANDIPGQFVAECCTLGQNLKIKSGELYKAYHEWCIETGHKPQSMTSLSSDWDRLGFGKYIAAGNTFRRGIDIK